MLRYPYFNVRPQKHIITDEQKPSVERGGGGGGVCSFVHLSSSRNALTLLLSGQNRARKKGSGDTN